MIYSTMVGVRYMYFCQQERAQNSANFDIKYTLLIKLAVMHPCLSTIDISAHIIMHQAFINSCFMRNRRLWEP